MPKRAAVYARYSSDNQRVESITAQLRACREYCRKNQYQIINEYCDEAKTGKNASREAFQQMVKDARNKQFDIAVFHKIDRNSRNEYDYYYYKGQLKNIGVTMEYVDQKIDDSPEGQMMESMLVGMAAYYSRNLAREVQKGMRENAHQAKHNGGRPALGYDVKDGAYLINEKEAPIVRHIFSRRAEGASYNTIIAELNDRGWRTKRARPFGKNSILEILRNPKYIGIYQYGRILNSPPSGKRNSHQAPNENVIVVPDAVPFIVDRDIWDIVQSLIVRHSPGSGRAKRQYLLAGHIYCHCGALMQGTSTTTRGQKYYYYKCGAWDRATGSACGHQRIPLEDAERVVLEDMENSILSPAVRPQVLQAIREAQMVVAGRQSDELDALDAVVHDANKRIEKIMDAVEVGGIDSAIAAQRLQAQKERLAGANKRIKDIGRKIKIIYLTDQQVNVLLDNLLLGLKEKQPGAIRLLIQKMMAKVTVGPDTVRVKLVLAFDGAGERT